MNLARMSPSRPAIPLRLLPPPADPLAGVIQRLLSIADPARKMLIGVTSATDGEGKTTIARGLALGLHRETGPSGATMLVDGIGQRAESDSGVWQQDWLDVVTTADLGYTSLSAELRRTVASGGAGLQAALKSLQAKHTFTVLDLPSVLEDPAATEVGQMVDQLYLVVRSGVTRIEAVQQALRLLDPVRVEGIILNDVQPPPPWLERWME